MVEAASGCGAVLILAMIGIGNIASVVVIGVLYGFCAGACEFLSMDTLVLMRLNAITVVTLMGPLTAILTDDMGELG